MEISNANYIMKSEIKLVTYIDLVKSVAGVPSFLLIICRFCFKQFERHYSSNQMLDSFAKGDKDENSKANTQKSKLGFCTQMRLFLFYENPIMFFFKTSSTRSMTLSRGGSYFGWPNTIFFV